ncbi:MAG TPA: porin [Parasulfuritortus sp.]
MKKSLIALAVAGAFATPAAFAASSNIDFYGKFRVSVDHIDNSVGWQMTDETSRVGFKGAEDLGGGLKAIYQWESGFNIGTAASHIPSTGNAGGSYTGGTTSLGAQRNTFLGLAGDFGTVLAGRHDTPYKMVGSADLFGDTLADAETGSALLGFGGTNLGNNGLCIICEDVRVSNAIAYVSPSFSGLTIAAATVVGSGNAGTGTVPSVNSLSDAQSIAAMYNNGPLSLGLGYENLGKVAQAALGGGTAGKPDAWKLNAGYTIDSWKLGATYEHLDKIGGVSGQKANNWLASVAYGMGPITLAAQYGYRNFNGTANTAGAVDLTDATVGVVYSLSKRTSTYLGYAHYKAKNSATVADAKYNVVTVGLNHDF